MHFENDLNTDLKALVTDIEKDYTLPAINSAALPLLMSPARSRDCQFMALVLEDGSTGISYTDIPDDYLSAYQALSATDLRSRSVVDLAMQFGENDPVQNMLAMSAINAICQHVMRCAKLPLETAPSPWGNLNLQKGDTLGMVGFFKPILHEVKQQGAELVIVEKNNDLALRYPQFPLTMDQEMLKRCNKILITSVAILNGTFDSLLSFCKEAEHITVVGPTAGYLPDPLFKRGVDTVGGRYIHDGVALLDCIQKGKSWGSATQKILFDKKSYVSPLKY